MHAVEMIVHCMYLGVRIGSACKEAKLVPNVHDYLLVAHSVP